MTLSYRLMPAREQAPYGGHPFHTWKGQSGGVWVAFYRTGDGYFLRFPRLADFEISAGGADALCWPTPDLPEGTREQLFLNQVLPLMLSEQGRLVFHASCVECGAGAIAFLGSTGRGKSTLAAAFAADGIRFLTDDVLVVKPDGDAYLALPSHPSIRLWSDSREALMRHASSFAPPVHYSEKSRILAAGDLLHCAEPRRLLSAYTLGMEGSGKVAFRSLRGADAVAGWLRHAFVLDVEDRTLLRKNLEDVAGLTGTVPLASVDYPRCYDELGRVRKAIVQHAVRESASA
jgi:hypothetical protein